MQSIRGGADLVAEMRLIAGRGRFTTRRMLTPEASTSPTKRTAPPRSPSAMAMAFRAFATSIPTKPSLQCSTASPGQTR